MKTDIHSISLPAPEYGNLTYPRFRRLLAETNSSEDLLKRRLANGATVDGEPVGLALLSLEYGDAERRLLSIFVKPAYRRRGIGRKLLLASETAATAEGTKKLVALHSSRMARIHVYEKLMLKANWRNPEIIGYRLGGRADWALQATSDWAPFLKRIRRNGFAVTEWIKLTDDDRQSIGSIVASLPEEDQAFDPFKNDKLELIPELCVALRAHDEVVGWILGVKGELDGYVYYSHGYAVSEFQRRGWLIAGMVEVCRRQAALLGADTISAYTTDRPAMRQLMEKRMKPYTIWMDRRYRCEKELVD